MSNFLLVPDFGITDFYTFKYKHTNSFRPSGTDLSIDMSLNKAMCEYYEEKYMVLCSKYHSKENILDNKLSPKDLKPFENTKDTVWYNNENVEYVNFKEILSYNGEINDNSEISCPKDISLFIRNINSDKKSLHWSNSGGFAFDKYKHRSLSKGISELLENHFKMMWWFGNNKLKKLNVQSLNLFNIINKQKIVKEINVFLIDKSPESGSYVCICILKTYSFPFVSIGFGADYSFYRSIKHSMLESIHYYRGANWYVLTGESKNKYTKKNVYILSLVKKSVVNNSLDPNYMENINPSKITNNHKFLGKTIVHNKHGYVTKVFSKDLQPLISNELVPFYSKNLLSSKNVQKRRLFNGCPFI